MTSARAWARRDLDTIIGWGDVDDAILEAIDSADVYAAVSFSMWFGIAHARFARSVAAILDEHARDDRLLILRWAKS